MSTSLKSIPLCQLQASKINVRKTDRLVDVEQLAASIHANGLLENLVVQRSGKTKGRGRYDVVAGGRRLAALKLLARRKKVPQDQRIPCLILEDGVLRGTEVSLVENVERAPLHPADQFEAFAGLVRDGVSVEDVAARFSVTATFVQQRLKLASVSLRLVAAYREGAMTLEQLTAFTLSDDHALQEATWFDSPYADMPAGAIRRLLTSSQVSGHDRRARFIGAKAYEEAGGTIIRDLFDTEDSGYFADSQLLDRLVGQKLEEAAQAVRGEGWHWVEVRLDASAVELGRFGRAPTVERRLSKQDEKRLRKLGERYDELVAALEEEAGEATEEIDTVTIELEALEARKQVWPDEEKAKAGAIVTLGQDACVQIVRGLVPRLAEEGRESRKAKAQRADGYSAAVMTELSAHQTTVLREVVADRPGVALAALLHALVGALLYDGPSDSCLTVSASVVAIERASKTVAGSKAGVAFQQRHAAWLERLPEREALWAWLEALSQDDQLGLLAHCTALTVDALEDGSRGRGSHAGRLLEATGIDMADWWRPTEANFFGRLTKAEILAAVGEGVSQVTASRLATLKKDKMAAEAAALFADNRWLPAPLRLPQQAAE